MSTTGFPEAYANSFEVSLAHDLIVKVASLAGLALMKIVAWDERHFERDAEDLALIMRHYLDAGVLSDKADQFGADALAMAMIRNKANYYGD